MRKNLFKIIVGCVSVFMVFNGIAQPLYKADLGKVRQAGFYKVVLSPEIMARSLGNLADIRIINEEGQQISYILKKDDGGAEDKNFISFPILSVKKEADKLTHIIILNALKTALDQLVLVIKNTDAERTITVSGSDDNKNWFVIKENIPLNRLFQQKNDHSIEAINFPYSSYAYFKIIINGKDQLPVNIINAGIYAQALRNGNYLPVPAATVTQTDSSDKTSYITASFNNRYLINRIEIQVTGTKFYKRTLNVFNNSNGRKEYVGTYSLSSASSPFFAVTIKSNELQLEINNEDNPPLTVSEVNAFQLNTYVLTWLESGNDYSLLFGNSLAVTPKYDLAFFGDSIGKAVIDLPPGAIKKNDIIVTDTAANTKSNLWLWCIIGLALVILLIFTARMAKEVNQAN